MSISRFVLRKALVLLSTGILLGSLTPSAMADNQPPPATKVADEMDKYLASVPVGQLRNREDLNQFQNWLVTQPEYPDGIVVTRDDDKSREKEFLWHNYESSKFRSRVISEAARRGISTKFSASKYDYRTFDTAARKLMATESLSAFGGQFKISAILGVDFDYDGLTVQGAFTSKGGPLSTQLKADTAASVDSKAEELTGVSVRVVESPPIQNTVTRSTDLPAFNAGGLISNGSGLCSTGFSVYLAGVGNRTTTARHCGGTWRAANRSASYYGSAIRSVGIAQANILSASGSQWMFDGAYNDSNGYKKAVQQLQDVSLNGYVCTSGGNSGVHCNLQILNLYVLHNDGVSSEPQIRARHVSGWKANAGGDSGGPVLVPYSNGKVGAVGMIQASYERLDYGEGCARLGGQAFYGWCYADVLFTSTRTMINNMPAGSRLVTG